MKIINMGSVMKKLILMVMSILLGVIWKRYLPIVSRELFLEYIIAAYLSFSMSRSISIEPVDLNIIKY